MKRKILLIFGIFLIIFVGHRTIEAQTDRPEDEAMRGKRSNSKAWMKLNQIQTLGSIQVLLQDKGQQSKIMFNSDKIKSVLERSGINENVTIQCATMDGKVLGNLGSFKPDHKSSQTTNPISQKQSSIQPNPMTKSRFSSMPLLLPVKSGNPATPQSSPAQIQSQFLKNTNSIKLLFKDASGVVKASLIIQLQVTDQRATKRVKEKIKIKNY